MQRCGKSYSMLSHFTQKYSKIWSIQMSHGLLEVIWLIFYWQYNNNNNNNDRLTAFDPGQPG